MSEHYLNDEQRGELEPLLHNAYMNGGQAARDQLLAAYTMGQLHECHAMEEIFDQLKAGKRRDRAVRGDQS